ncbi:hypothetical protein RhiirA5_361762 [Rhizophagus irregularis]|uniref:Uncharacterized protein n=1 Tax=Rhizophagus irregularis TaxID=588596 RepID=A0A2N0S6F9_9GLOM|nr:hypothetical protein RhiirA5_361762 [Rhizophagus irregularis]PKC71146.1 hypothetical protein RhiirA1_413571 [Rhizophagus irregularis]
MYKVIPELMEIGVGNDLGVILSARELVVEDVPEGVLIFEDVKVTILSLLFCGLLLFITSFGLLS